MARTQGLLASHILRRALLPTQATSAAIDRTSSSLLACYSSSTSNPRFFSPTSHLPVSSSKPPLSLAFAGALSFSFAASSFSTEALAKEPPSPNLLPRNVVLYQYEACPFCNKIKAFLDYHDIPYEVVEVNPLSKKEIKWSDYKKVPILTVDGEQLVDSSDIVEKLTRRIHPEKPVDDEEEKWRRWVDEHLVHVLSPNIYRNTSEAIEAFDYITSHENVQMPEHKKLLEANNFRDYVNLGRNFSFTERLSVKYAGAAAMYFVSKKLKKKYNITDERAALYEAAETWVEALNGRNFLGGSKPDLADLAVFGVLRPIRYLKAGRDMVDNTRIGEWYTRMETAVGESSRIKA